MLAQGSHRSVRAGLPHTVPQVTTFASRVALRCCCVDTRSEIGVSGMFPSNGVVTRRVAFLHGVRSSTFPRFAGTINTLRLPAARLAALRCLRLAIPRFHLVVSVPDGPDAITPSLELVTRYLRPGTCRGNDRISHVPGESRCVFALLSDPGGIDMSDHHNTPTRPPLCPQRRLPQMYFRGSITQLQHWLSTLRRPGYPDTTQDSLPVAGQALPDGIGYPQDSNERFQTHIMLVILPSQAFVAQGQAGIRY